MDKKMIYAVAMVAILVVAAAAVFVVYNKDEDNGKPSVLDQAELKVFGNINGDRYLDQKDANLIQQLIDDGKTAEEYPLADANQDGVLDKNDVQVVKDVVAGNKTTIWHINYHDTDGDSTMDEEIVSTQYPIKSAIMTASSNTALLMFMLGIVDEIKGASYSGLDKTLFSDTYLNTDKVERLGTSSTTITFEGGKAGSSDVIAKNGVTAVISDWNRSYLKNESDFENSGIDVIRVAAAAIDRDVMAHSALLIGLLFQKVDRAVEYLNLSFSAMDYVIDAVKDVEPVSAVASSTDAAISGENSDYTKAVLMAGATFGAKGIDFGGSSSAKIADHPEFNLSDCRYVIHLRTSITYGQTDDSNKAAYEKLTGGFSEWKYAEDGQFVVSGTIPVFLRPVYCAAALHPDVISLDKADELHQEVVDKLFNGLDLDISSMKFLVTPTTYA